MGDGDERVTGKERVSLLEHVAKNPIPTLRSNIARGKTCSETIVFLQQVRAELGALLGQDLTKKISSPDPAFKQFYIYGNGTPEHHVGLFSMLKATGFSRGEIESALMDNMPLGKRGGNPQKPALDISDRSDQVRKYLALTQTALDKVFAAHGQ